MSQSEVFRDAFPFDVHDPQKILGVFRQRLHETQCLGILVALQEGAGFFFLLGRAVAGGGRGSGE